MSDVARPDRSPAERETLNADGKDAGESWEDYARRLERRIKDQRDHIKSLAALHKGNGNRADRKKVASLRSALATITEKWSREREARIALVRTARALEEMSVDTALDLLAHGPIMESGQEIGELIEQPAEPVVGRPGTDPAVTVSPASVPDKLPVGRPVRAETDMPPAVYQYVGPIRRAPGYCVTECDYDDDGACRKCGVLNPTRFIVLEYPTLEEDARRKMLARLEAAGIEVRRV